MNRRQKIIVSITGIFIVMLALVGLTYAYFLTRITGNENEKSINVTTANLEILYTSGEEIRVDNIIPITESEIISKGSLKKFSLALSETSNPAHANIELSILNITDNLKDYDFKWALYEGTTKKITTGTFAQAISSDKIILANNVLVNSTTPTEYNLYIWLEETGVNQSSMMNGTLEAKITIVGTRNNNTSLASAILGENNENVLTANPTFTTTSTDRGLFVQQGSSTKSVYGFPTYYYRGSATNDTINPDYVMNNYVSFGTYATSGSYTYKTYDEATDTRPTKVFNYTKGDPILWRIVRINEDGSIRLISENINSDYLYYTTSSDVNYINETGDSIIKTTVENWYNTNIGVDENLDSKVITSSFCNDITGLELDYYKPSYIRISNEQPIFKCPNGSIIANEKAGLITADEMIYAGSMSLEGSVGEVVVGNTTYLGIDTYFWTNTPSRPGYIMAWSPTGHMTGITPYERDHGTTRVVINLSPDVIIKSGDGLSAQTAYVIE